MKGLIVLLSILIVTDLSAQVPDSAFSFEFGISGNKFEYGEKGFAISNGILYRLSPRLSVSPTFLFAYGFYRYYQNQIEPSFVEARYFSFQLPLRWMAPGKLSFIGIRVGPQLTFRSRFENDTFRLFTRAGTTRIYSYDYGYMYNTLYVGITGQIEALIFRKKRLSFLLFVNGNAYFNPFKIDYYGAGLKSTVSL
jgi:hypothetical protein